MSKRKTAATPAEEPAETDARPADDLDEKLGAALDADETSEGQDDIDSSVVDDSESGDGEPSTPAPDADDGRPDYDTLSAQVQQLQALADQRHRENEQLVQYMYELRSKISSPAQTQPQPQPAESTAQQQQHYFNAAKWNQVWDYYRDNGGINTAPPDVQLAYYEYQKQQRENLERLGDGESFNTYIKGLIQQELDQFKGQVPQLAQNQLQQTYSQSALWQTLANDQQYIVERDASGKPLTTFNPITGQWDPVLNNLGRQLDQNYRQVKQAGVVDDNMALAMAKQMLAGQFLPQFAQGNQQAAPAATNGEHKKNLVRDAAKRTQNRGGAVVPHTGGNAPPRSKKIDYEKEMAQRMEEYDGASA